MNLNATIIGQMIAFALFVVFCMKYVWPPIMAALDERKKEIAEGLAAAERGKHEEELAANRAQQVILEANDQANKVIAKAQRRGNEIVDEAKGNAQVEGNLILTSAISEIERKTNRAKDELRLKVGSIALSGAAIIISREIDGKAHTDLLEELANQI